MDFVRAVKFPFEDRDWIAKFVVGTLATLIGLVLPFIPLGYQVYVARQVMRRDETPLPGTEQLGRVVTDGLMAFIALLIYAIPAFAFACVIAGMGAVMGQSDLGGLLFACFTLCLTGFVILYGLVATAFFWMGVIRYAESGNFADFVRFRLLWRDLRDHSATLLVLLAYVLGFSFIMAFITPVLAVTIIGIPLVIFYTQLVTGHLLGQAGREIARGV